MKVVLAPDSWSGFSSAPAIARDLAQVLAEHHLTPVEVPMADGGEGTTLVLLRAGARPLTGVQVAGPDGGRVQAPVCDWNGVTFVEAARVIGPALLLDPVDPLARRTHGLGEALALAVVGRTGPLIVGLGGSSTLDGGAGMLQALGLRLEDARGKVLRGHVSAHDLGRIARVRGEPPLPFQVVQAWCDVETPLQASAARFGPQKGASAEQIEHLETALARWGDTLNRWRQEQRLREVPVEAPGGGAAGGLGFALRAALDARLVPGAPAVARAIGLERHLRGARAVVTGEGRIDPSSFAGKVVGTVVEEARAAGVEAVGVLAGEVRGELPGPPRGPDWAVGCGQGPDAERAERFAVAAAEVARRLSSG